MRKALYAAEAMRHGGKVTRCVNLREESDGRLHAVGRPAMVLADCEMTPAWCCRVADAGTVTIMAGNGRLGLLADERLHDLGPCDRVLCGMASGPDVLVMTDGGPIKVWRDPSTDEWRRSAAGDWPELRLFADDAGIASATVDALTLAQTVGRSGVLGSKDLGTLTKRVTEAYTRMVTESASAGRFMQPVLARYKLRDAGGRLLVEGPPVIVGPESGFQCMGGVTVPWYADSEGKVTSTGEGTLKGESFRLGVELCGKSLSEGMYAEIYVSPMLHPVELTGASEYRFTGLGMTQGSLLLTVPGTTDALSGRAAAITARYASVPAMMDIVERKVATLREGDFGGTAVVTVGNAGFSSLKSELRALATQQGDAGSENRAMVARLAAPNRFSAQSVCCSGDSVVWGGLTRIPFGGYSPLTLGAGSRVELRGFSQRITLTDSSGRIMRRATTLNACTGSLHLSPLVTFPDASATRLEIRARTASGDIYEADIELVASLNGAFAYYLDPKMKSIELQKADSGSFEPFEGDECRERLTGAVAVGARENPLMVKSAGICSESSVVQVLPSWGANANWDYGLGRFYLITPDGILGMAVDKSWRIKASLIEPRGSYLTRGAVLTPYGVMALAGEDLIRLSGTRASTVAYGVRGLCVGYCSGRSELWIKGSDGVTIHDLSTGSFYTRAGLPVDAMVDSGDTLLIKSSNALLSAIREDKNGSVEIGWTREAGEPWARLMTYVTDMDASEADVEVSVSGGGENWHTHRVKGVISAPIGAKVLCGARMNHYLDIRGHVSGDFSLGHTEWFSECR